MPPARRVVATTRSRRGRPFCCFIALVWPIAPGVEMARSFRSRRPARRDAARGRRAAAVALSLVAACHRAQPISPADFAGLRAKAIADVEQEGVALAAAVLDEKETRRLLHPGTEGTRVVPVVFQVANRAEEAMEVKREDFRLRIDERWELAPALPGRAAALLRDTRGSTEAALAGWILFGALAAPSINAAERHEEAAVEANRERLFAVASVAPGASTSGYLLFEAPARISASTRLELRLAIPERVSVSLPLTNPHTH